MDRVECVGSEAGECDCAGGGGIAHYHAITVCVGGGESVIVCGSEGCVCVCVCAIDSSRTEHSQIDCVENNNSIRLFWFREGY